VEAAPLSDVRLMVPAAICAAMLSIATLRALSGG
jgi:hypothetical protein